jgi:hypothetical protein
MSLTSGQEEAILKGNGTTSSVQEASQQPAQRASEGLTYEDSQTAHKTPASSLERKPQNERHVKTHPIDKKALGPDSEKIEKLKAEVSIMQRSTSEAIESSEKQHEQQRQGIEKEFHKKKNKNLLRVAAKAEVKNLADTALGTPYEGAKTLVKRLTGESQKKP